MKTLRELLESKSISISLQYYGTQDYATGLEVKRIVENPDIFDDLCSRFPIRSLSNLDDYYLYLLYTKFAAMDEIIPLLQQAEHKKIMTKLSEDAKNAVSDIEVGDVIKYINTNYQDIFDKEKTSHDMQFITIDIIAKYSNGINRDVFVYLSKEYGYLLLQSYDKFEKVFEQYPDVFSAIYTSGQLAEVESLGLETTLDIWNRILHKEHSTIKTRVIDLVDVLSEDIKELCGQATDGNTMRDIMIVDNIARKLHSFLQRIQSPKANDFNKYAKAVAELLEKRINEEGQSFEFEIPVNEIIDKWKTIEKWEMRLLSISHILKAEEDSISCISQLSKQPEGKHSIIDDVSTNIPTDEYFTMSHQQMISCIASIGTGTIIGILRDQACLIEYLNCVASAVVIISECMNVEGEHLRQDMDMLSAMVQLIVNNPEMDKNAMAGVCYGALMFICAFIEKILRLYYIFLVKDDMYIPIKKTTLGELLVTKNTYMVEAFGENHIRHLAFFLQQSAPANVGLNYRNELAHWIDIAPMDMTRSLLAEMLWLFTDVINTVFWNLTYKKGEKDDE